MTAKKGVQRIYLLAKRIMIFGPILGAVLWVLTYYALGHESIFELIMLLAIPFVAGGSLWLLAWIVDGFVSPLRASEPHPPN